MRALNRGSRNIRLCRPKVVRSPPVHIAAQHSMIIRGRVSSGGTATWTGAWLKVRGDSTAALALGVGVIRRGSGKPRLVYPGARPASAAASTPVAES
jgi:hypothetical protein